MQTTVSEDEDVHIGEHQRGDDLDKLYEELKAGYVSRCRYFDFPLVFAEAQKQGKLTPQGIKEVSKHMMTHASNKVRIRNGYRRKKVNKKVRWVQEESYFTHEQMTRRFGEQKVEALLAQKAEEDRLEDERRFKDKYDY